MATKKYVSFSNLTSFFNNLKSLFATKTEIDSKSDKIHTHSISDITNLQSTLNNKANTSHGTHVTYSTTTPAMDGVASSGSASTVSRSDHVHPTDSTRAAQTSLDSHTGNTTSHITNTERSSWNSAYTHSQSAHAPSNAEANQNAFSNVKIGDVTIAADIKTDTLTLVAGNNITLTPDANGDSITISSKDTNTTYSAGAGISLSGTTFTNSGVRSVGTGSSNGTISVNTNGASTNVAVKGLGSAAYTASTAYDAAGTAQTKSDAALSSAKAYTDSVKNDLLNGAGAAYDTLKELGNLIDENADAIDALETVASGKADKSHTHDDRYYTETEINSKISTLNSSIAGKANSSHNHAITDITNLQSSLDGKAASDHTHKYAGSSSIGGAATSANKINTDAGSATQPVYFANGIPVATTYTLGKSVPSNAVFTDTHYASKNVVGATNATSNTATTLTNGNVYINSVENGTVTSSHKISGAGATTVTTDTSGNIVITSTDNNTTYSAAGSSLGLVKSGGDVTISSGVITVNDDSHNHTIANVDNLQSSLDAKQATVTGGASTITSSNLTANRALISDSSGKVAVSAVTSTELGYLDGVTSNVQTQLDGKAGSSHNHAASNITSGTLSSDRLPTVPIAKGGTGATTAAGALTNLGITATATELNYVDGVTSNIQTQLNGKSGTSHTHSYLPLSGGTITGNLIMNGNEQLKTHYAKKVLGQLSAGTAYANLSSTYKDGTYHRMWRLRFPSNTNFWGRIKVILYGTYSSFNASGVMSKSIICSFNTNTIYNNVGSYDGLGINVEQDFRISEAIWNSTENAWEILIWQKNLNGNNSPQVMLEIWTSSQSYLDSALGITVQTVELTQDTSYTASKASPTGGTKTVIWANTPVYETPLGLEISTVGHTHNYAGSSSAGGSATSAVKLDTSTAGSATQPVYFSNGKPVACTYTLGKSVPSNAVFTDTNTKVTNTLATTTKAYVTGTTSASTNTGTQVFDTGVYLDTTAGQLTATTFNGTTFSGSGVATVSEVETYLGI